MKNLLLISIDAFGADKCWNLKNAKMNFLKKLTKKGIKFTKFFSSTSSTTPSMASIHTGKYPMEHGIISTYGHELKDNIGTLAEEFKKNGYKTYASVSGPLMESTNLNRGFDNYWYHKPLASIKVIKWTIARKRTKLNNILMKRERKKVFNSNYKWFYWIHLLDVHNRWRNKSKIKDNNLSDYEKAVLDLDKKLEIIINEVNLDDTMIVITADHGHYVAEIDKNIQGIDYDEAHGFGTNDILVNVPLIIVNNDFDNVGKEINNTIASVDLMPTLFEIMNFKSTYNGFGNSFFSLINKKDFTEKPIFLGANGAILRSQGQPFLYALREKNMKIVLSQDKGKRKPELYDLNKDPNEENNIYNSSSKETQVMEEKINKFILKVKNAK